MADNRLLQFAAALRIAHHIPGRIRLKLESGAGDLGNLMAEAQKFGAALGSLPAIRSVKLNPLARSCTVEYDPGSIPPAAWQDLLAGTASPAAEVLLKTLAAAAER